MKKTKNKSARGPLYRAFKSPSQFVFMLPFQRSERFLHLTKVVSLFSPPCGDTEAASFPQTKATWETPMVLSPAVVSVLRILCAEPPLKIASRHERADHPRSASANATPPVTVDQCTLSAKKPKRILKTDNKKKRVRTSVTMKRKTS